MSTDFRVPALITVSALFVNLFQTIWCGHCRGKYDMPAPKTTGNVEFEKAFRSHQNMVESLVWFVPSLFIFHRYVSEKYAAIFGWLFVVSRIAFHCGYCSAKPLSREFGFAGSMLAQGVFLIGSAATLIRSLRE